VMVPEVGLEPT